jgi:hypothetical protein
VPGQSGEKALALRVNQRDEDNFQTREFMIAAIRATPDVKFGGRNRGLVGVVYRFVIEGRHGSQEAARQRDLSPVGVR